MAQKINLTNSMISKAKLYDKEYTIWDSGFKGLGVRIRPTGLKNFILTTYIGLIVKKTTLCTFPNHTVEYARELASQKYDEIIKNFNEGIKPPPVIEKEKLTFAQVCHRYIDEYSKLYKKPNTTDADERSIENRNWQSYCPQTSNSSAPKMQFLLM